MSRLLCALTSTRRLWEMVQSLPGLVPAPGGPGSWGCVCSFLCPWRRALTLGQSALPVSKAYSCDREILTNPSGRAAKWAAWGGVNTSGRGHHSVCLVHPGLSLEEQHGGGGQSSRGQEKSRRASWEWQIRTQPREEECGPWVLVGLSASHQREGRWFRGVVSYTFLLRVVSLCKGGAQADRFE